METNKTKKAYSKQLAKWILIGDLILSICTLAICVLAIFKNYNGGLPYLVSLIGIYNIATGYVLGKYFDKSKAENIRGGIVYDSVINTDKDCD